MVGLNFSEDIIYQVVVVNLGINMHGAVAHKEGIDAYGSDNDMRLTGLHETQSIDQFSYGVSDRGASIRIPVYTVEHNWNGYLEDRRPASNADPYKILSHIVGTLTK